MFVGENKRVFAAVASPPPSCCNLLDYVRLCFRQGLRTADGQSDLRAAFVRVGPFKGNPISGAPLLSLFRSDVYQTTPTHSGIISPLTISDGCTARTREALRLSLPLAGVSERQCGIHFIVNVQLSGFQFRKRGGLARARLLRDFQRRVLKFHITLA